MTMAAETLGVNSITPSTPDDFETCVISPDPSCTKRDNWYTSPWFKSCTMAEVPEMDAGNSTLS